MKQSLKISDFVKLTGSTLKTILYYHKIGLLPEPERSQGGYRLYGAGDLTRMQLIKHLKSLGMDLKRIKDIVGDKANDKTLREVLESLRLDLLREKESLEERIAHIDSVLGDDKIILDEDMGDSPSFRMIKEILKPEQVEAYAQTCPELFAQQRKLFGILDDFQWGEDNRDTFRALAEHFQAHPEQYQRALEFGVRLSRLNELSEDEPEIELLALEATEFIKSIPQLRELLCRRSGMKQPLSGLYSDVTTSLYSPARLKHMELFQKYLDS